MPMHNSQNPKVLMLGPDLANRGGIASIEQIYLDAWDYDRYTIKHIPTFINGSKLEKLWVLLRAVITYIYEMVIWRPDILHIHFSVRASFYRKSLFVNLARISPVYIVFHCNAPDFDAFYESRSSIIQQYMTWTLSSADRLLVVAKQWHDYFTGLPVRIPIATIYNPVHLPEKAARASEKDPNIVLSLGRLGKRKGIYDTLKAIPSILETCSNVEFWFGGDGEIDRVKNLISTEPWCNRVRLLGWVRGENKTGALLRASVFLLPSYHEGLPVAILEAMAYGLPVVSTVVGGIPEVVSDGKTGFLIQPGDVDSMARRVSQLLVQTELRQRMSDAARKVISERFEVHSILQQLYGIYDDLLSRRRKV
jgi:glycosyltransferase involved in cell wall biosynthesis